MKTCRGVEEVHLADTLENTDGVLEETDVEHGHDEFDVCIVTDAINRVQAARLTESILFSCTLRGRCQELG